MGPPKGPKYVGPRGICPYSPPLSGPVHTFNFILDGTSLSRPVCVFVHTHPPRRSIRSEINNSNSSKQSCLQSLDKNLHKGDVGMETKNVSW